MKNKRSVFHVKKHTLLAVAGCVWLIAGFNVARLGVLSYQKIMPFTFVHILLSIVVFCAFGMMFFKMSIKHTKWIKGYKEEWKMGVLLASIMPFRKLSIFSPWMPARS